MSMNVIVDKLIDSGLTDEDMSERMVFQISDEMLLKLGRKYFELASNPVVSTYVNELPDDPAYTISVSPGKSMEELSESKRMDFFDFLRSKYSIEDFITKFNDVCMVKLRDGDAEKEAEIFNFIYEIYRAAKFFRPKG